MRLNQIRYKAAIKLGQLYRRKIAQNLRIIFYKITVFTAAASSEWIREKSLKSVATMQTHIITSIQEKHIDGADTSNVLNINHITTAHACCMGYQMVH